MAHICSILHKDDLAVKYAAEASRLKTLFQHKYITASGNLMSNTQTGRALAIQFELYPSPIMLATAQTQLRKLVRAAKFHISTGFAGTNLIAPALTTVGVSQLAYRMLLEKTCPSWLNPVTMGATKIWERWKSMLPDGRNNPGQMTSFNHYAHGAVAEWLRGSVGGINIAEAGWKVVRVRPVPGGNVTWAKVTFNGPYGRWSVSGR